MLSANGSAISKWKGPGRCDKRMEGGSLGGAISKWKGPGRCDKQREGGSPGGAFRRRHKQMEGAWAVR